MPSSTRSRALLALVLLLATVGVVLVVRALTRTDEPVAAPSPSPTVTAAPTQAAVEQPKPFRVALKDLRGEPMDNAMLFGGRPDARRPVVQRAGRSAVRTLERYLNAAFVAPKSRFTAGPLRPLLTQRALAELTSQSRAALAARGPKFEGGRTGPAVARATVLYSRGDPLAVTLRYKAALRTDTGDKSRRLVQQGTMVFVKAPNGWRADQVDVELIEPPTREEKKKASNDKRRPGKKKKGSP